jgi:hypothetical protein
MATISQKLANLVGGVSQQPDNIKFSNNLRVCDNFLPDFTTGLNKRPGLQSRAKLANAVNDGTWFHIFRDNNERYIYQFSKAGALKIWDANTGIQQTINTVAAEATAYATHTFSSDLATLQINDYVFVLNRTVVTKQGTATSGGYNPFGFVNINSVAFNTDYIIVLDGLVFSHTTPNNSGGATHNSIQTIISALVAAITANPLYQAYGIGNSIVIQRTNYGDFSLRASGGVTGTAVEAFKEVVPTVAQLPREFFSGNKIKVEGSVDNEGDDYWVEFVPATPGQTSGAGYWQETIAPNTILGMDSSTLPHAIIREANGTFTYRRLDPTTVSGSTATVAGIPTSASVLSAVSGGHVVGEEFAPTGGSGANLRLKVATVRSQVTTLSYPATSTINYVQKLTSSTLNRKTGFTYTYIWFENGVQIGVTTTTGLTAAANVSSLTIGDSVYTFNGAFQTVGNETRCGLTKTTTLNGIINTVSIIQAGQGYTTGNTVTNASGDSFTLNTVSTQTVTGDTVTGKYWKNRSVGDSITNPMPSFIDNPIDSISFFKNRLIFTSRQNVICSQAGDYFHFFNNTVITIIDSDPIDISASSLKPIKLQHTIPVPRGLLLFGDNAQYILETTTEAFSPKTAEVNLLSSYSQTDTISPIDMGPSYIFIEQGDKTNTVYEMNIGDNMGGKPDVQEITRPVPFYIPASIKRLKVSQAANLFCLLSEQDPSAIYFYRFFNAQNRISAWFKWNIPGTVESFDFDQDIMYIITKQDSNYLLSTVSLITETPNPSLLFEGDYFDVRLDFFDYNPTLVYRSATNTTRVCFKDGFENTVKQPVLVYLNATIAGSFEELPLLYDATAAVGQRYYLEVDGNQTTSKFAIGYKYEALAELPAFYYIKEEGKKDTVNIPSINRLQINSYNSGPFKTLVSIPGRDDFYLSLPQITSNIYSANSIPIIRNAKNTVPIFAKGDQVRLSLIADSPFPTSFTSLTWEGTYNNRGIQAL